MRILLVCNYAPDAQQSMRRFGEMLHDGLAHGGCEVSTVAPFPRFQKLFGERKGKWLGYLDKYVLFPSALARRVRTERRGARNPLVVHIVDHSNAVYVPRRSAEPWVATCHDLLAVRGALGEDTDCPASALGRRLQRAIVRGLSRATAVVTDSTSTQQDLARLVPPARAQIQRTILLGLNHPYRPIAESEARARLTAIAGIPWDQPFVLHVGSNLSRKNKAGVLRVFARVSDRWPGNLVFCGAELNSELRAHAAGLDVAARVFAVPAPDNAQLEAIYRLAHALIFPSKCEGFGWPVIEAQACGCPVVCSDRTSLPEIGGDAALVHELADEAGMAESVRRLFNGAFRAAMVARGFRNLQRFDTGGMIDAYREVYEEVLAVSGS